MTPYELMRWLALPLLPFFNVKVRGDVRELARPGQKVLDVGGRRSPHTVGLPIEVTVLDLPQESETQAEYGLGVNAEVLARLRKQRSNVLDVVLEDMTRTRLPSQTFDGVVCVEVIEHVDDDERFVEQIARVLRPGGWAYFTTPNGDYMPIPQGDHRRHYKREELRSLLHKHFRDVEVTYGVATGKDRLLGLRALTPRRPLQTVRAVLANVRHRKASAGLEDRAVKTANLFAVARNPRNAAP